MIKVPQKLRCESHGQASNNVVCMCNDTHPQHKLGLRKIATRSDVAVIIGGDKKIGFAKKRLLGEKVMVYEVKNFKPKKQYFYMPRHGHMEKNEFGFLTET